ncbi:MAG TPA: cyclic nucleotide-binding domain-containing protein [Polyangiaceae bacterium]|nr:cyclic nucleotide-binding domain-containing protein [Polyangiaceae bacterium]
MRVVGAAVVRALGLRPGEAGVVAPAALYAALAVGATTLADVASSALYVAAFPAGALGRLYVLTSAGRVAVAFAYATLGQKSGRARLDAAVVAWVGAFMAASAGAPSRLGPAGLTAVVLALSTLPQLLPLIGFQAAIDCLNARQAKRLLPVLAAAATAGTVAASGAARALAGAAGTAWLLALGALLCAAALPLPGLLHRQAWAGAAPPPPGAAKGPGEPAPSFFRTIYESFGDLGAVPAAKLVAAYALLSALGQNLTDYAWKSALKAEGGGPDAVAAALASFSISTGVLTLAAQLLVAGAFVARVGVRGSLAVPPAALVLLGPLFAIAPGVPAAAALKGAEVVTRYGVGTAAADLLLTPVPAASRLRVKALVKGAAGPLGLGLAGALIGLSGAEGPPPLIVGALVALTGALGFGVTRAARRAYADALAGALGKGRELSDVSPHSAALVRRELKARLKHALAGGEDADALAVLAVLDGHLFTVADIAPALAASAGPSVRRAALEAARRVLRAGDGPALLAAAPPFDEPDAEADLLALAVRFGGRPDGARLAAARAQADLRPVDSARARLWAHAVRAEVAIDRERALEALRQAAAGGPAQRRAQALRALGELGDGRASRLVMQALGEPDADLFAEAARAAVLLELPGAVTVLAARLASGPHAAAAARALALAGPEAAEDLIELLPTTRGEPGAPPTARASGGRTIAGTVRAARALAGLGPAACERVLRDYDRLGYRARTAVCRALGRVPEATGRALDPAAVLAAMESTVAYAEVLVRALPGARPGGLLAGEISHRVEETAARLLDLASLVGDRARIGRARDALDGPARERGTALELLEQLLPRGLGRRTLALLEPAPASADGAPPRLDGWLERCAAFDRDELPPTDAMFTVLERVLVLRNSPLFHGLAGEELYPVAEVSSVKAYAPGEPVVREGDPGDALYVVADGSFEVERGGRDVRKLGPGDVFGEMSLLDGVPRAATVVASASGGRALRVPREDFEALLDESPELARGVIRTLLGHLRAAGG